MSMILYPTETIYGLGVPVFDQESLVRVYELKGREATKSMSWLVQDVSEIETYAEVGELAVKIAERFLPGPLTLVLPAKPTVPREYVSREGTIGFRISSDPCAQALIAEFDTPLTCTSANISGKSTPPTPQEILEQFGEKASMINRVIDDGPRSGLASTVMGVFGDEIQVFREGVIPEADIRTCL